MNIKLIKLIMLLIFFSVNTGYSSTEEIKAVDENDPNVLKFLNKRNITIALIQSHGQNFSISKSITFDSLTDANFLDTLYSNIPLKLKNKKRFLFGKVSSVGYVKESIMEVVKLELYFINPDNTLETKVFFKTKNLTDLLYKHYHEHEKLKDGFDYSPNSPKDMVTIITRYGVVHKVSEDLEGTEKELYDFVMKLFKDEIPREYFEYRDKGYIKYH